MATSLSLATAGLTATLSTDNDEPAQTVLLMFAHASGANPAWSNQQKLDYAVAQLAEYMRRIALERWKEENKSTFEAAANAAVHW